MEDAEAGRRMTGTRSAPTVTRGRQEKRKRIEKGRNKKAHTNILNIISPQ